MTETEYRKKIEGCWMGKNIGGTLGMPMEWNRGENEITYYTHKLTGEPLPNDDLDIQILWMIAMEDRGTKIDEKTLGEYFNEYMIFTHAEYGTAKVNLRAGLQPPVSGTFNNDFKDSCGSFIRSEIWACLYPGRPEIAAAYAFKDAVVDHGDGEGVYAEVFIAAMESMAFFEHNIRTLIKTGLSYIPDCAVSQCVQKAIKTFDNGINEKDSRDYIMKNYVGNLEWHYISPEDEKKGYAKGRMGWDVPSNMMIITYALLFGNGDFEKSVCTAVHYGEDTDCTAGTIAALFGIMNGIDFFPEKWIKPIGNRITTCSINPFLMMDRIPKTVNEMTDRVIVLHKNAYRELNLTLDPQDMFTASSWFKNIYNEMHTVKYEFRYLNVRLDYCGAPVIHDSEPKQIRFIITNTSKTISSERVNIYVYTKNDCSIYPAHEATVFLTMAHMGSGIKYIDFMIERGEIEKRRYEFVAEFKFEDTQFSEVMEVPFVLLSETGTTVPVLWEKNGSSRTPNMPRL
jgi:ADP-ribosylglycohydrolase